MAPAPENITEPLLDPSNGPIAEENGERDMGKPQKGVWAAEFRHILVLSAPAIVQLCTQQALVITNQVRCLQRLRAANSATSASAVVVTTALVSMHASLFSKGGLHQQ